ncbi:tyrosine-type recombinase/integrase [Methylobacterium sp. CM6244]
MPKKLPRYCIEDVDRYGKVRIYLRKPGQKKIRLHGTPWAPDFMRAYADALEGVVAAEPARMDEVGPGTWRALCVAYFASSEFAGYDVMTRKRRRSSLEATFAEKPDPKGRATYAEFPVHRMTSAAIRLLRDRKADTPEGANNRLKAIRAVFKWANKPDVQAASHDPSKAVQRIQNVTDGHHTWTEAKVNRFIDKHPIGTKAYLALCLLLYGGGRRSDVVVFGPQHVQVEAGEKWLTYTQHKGRNKNPMKIQVPILPELDAAIGSSLIGDKTFLVTSFGKPFTSNGFGNKMKEWCVEAGLPHCSSHGLRKAGATLAAESGATVNQMMAIFGWRTSDMAELYTRKAEQKRLAGKGMSHIKFVRTAIQPDDRPKIGLDFQDE